MHDIYPILREVFTTETMKSAIRQAGLVRQAHLAAALRKGPPSAVYGLTVIKAQHRFLEALCDAFIECDVPDEVCDAVGFHSFMFFGVNPRIFEISLLATAGSEEYSLEKLVELMKASDQADIDGIIRGEEYPLDTLRWLNHTGNNFATYLVKCSK